jgi:crotonobetainyl-CoA:carnitine CoA-transferase CaiB-like acyl-CoA transferase
VTTYSKNKTLRGRILTEPNKNNNSALQSCRVLDLTEGGCMIGGRILGDLGADVVKIEPPGGSSSRIGPFYKDIADPEKSLYWFAYNLNKRGITADITRPEGREIIKKLVKTADIVIESFDVGYLAKIGLGYDDLCKIKPDIILASITPFGQSGPKSHYKGSDLTAWASGGYLYICGDPDRPPNWMSFPQALLHAGAEAAAGSMTAFLYREMTGEGQQVDVSVQECVVACCFSTPEMWDLNHIETTRFARGIYIGTHKVQSSAVWKCKDGNVVLVAHGGAPVFANSMKALVSWMAKENLASEWLQEINWSSGYDASQLTQEYVDRFEGEIDKFFMTKTKKELYEEGALKRNIMIGPLSTTKDVFEDAQLSARDFWIEVPHPELNASLIYPGPFLKLSETKIEYRRRAPLIGEHNEEIYVKELGFSKEDLAALKKAKVI